MLFNFKLSTPSEGLVDITHEVSEAVKESGVLEGICIVFCPHTTAAITINENADPDVRTDLNAIFDRLVKEREPYYQHTLEGDDDMPSHAKSTLVGSSITIPITNGKLNLGIRQGIYLCEFRDYGSPREIVATIIGE